MARALNLVDHGSVTSTLTLNRGFEISNLGRIDSWRTWMLGSGSGLSVSGFPTGMRIL